MADYTINVTPEKLESTAKDFNSKANEVQKLTNNMLTLIQSTNATWKGNAATKYKNQFEALKKDMNQMYKMIQEHVSDLNAIAKNYEAAEAENENAARALETDVIS